MKNRRDHNGKLKSKFDKYTRKPKCNNVNKKMIPNSIMFYVLKINIRVAVANNKRNVYEF